MLELRNIVKDYVSKENIVHAVKGISLSFRENEFVSILGPSGCGKTTTLNIIGGLDRYTSGDLLIDGISTKKYKDKDWDIYRNHRVGFVFQSYNLIPHQTILSNVELALTIGNVDKSKRKELAIEALTKVGLGNEIYKKPSQLSGGQMQRVAIARAIVNKPSIILADEPTGALDSKTSRQVLNILKELSKDCLIVMVTHNEELAKEYSSRIVSLKDGEMISDTNPYDGKNENKVKEKKNKVGMNLFTSLKLSLDNLKSKLGRTILTSFAGSIGIIGIALILSVSAGFNGYINQVEASTLSENPVTITKDGSNYMALLTSLISNRMEDKESEANDTGKVVPNYVMVDFLKSIASSNGTNDIKSFKVYIDEHMDELEPYIRSLSYNYTAAVNTYYAYYEDETFNIKQSVPFALPKAIDGNGNITGDLSMTFGSRTLSGSQMESYMGMIDVWSKLYNSSEVLSTQYDFCTEDSRWPTKYNEVVIVVDENNRIDDMAIYAMGLAKDEGDQYVRDLLAYVNDTTGTLEDPSLRYNEKFTYGFDELIGTEFYCVPNSQYYKKDADLTNGHETFSKLTDDEIKAMLYQTESISEENMDNSSYLGPIKLKVVGVVKENPNSDNHSISGSIGYTEDLIDKIIAINNSSEISQAFTLANGEYSIVTTTSEAYGFKRTTSTKGKNNPSETEIKAEKSAIGQVDLTNPDSISIYPNSFDDKDKIIEFIDKYNRSVEENTSLSEIEAKALHINYTDMLGTMIGGITTIIDAITYVLIGFVSISLVVSSIMIAVITRISVMERTKEIGILRAMGASRKDVKTIFNAETFITGLISGLLGVLITILLNIPISSIVYTLSGIKNIATLPVEGGITLVIISFVLTVLSGLIPASYAAKCDPVIALRSE